MRQRESSSNVNCPVKTSEIKVVITEHRNVLLLMRPSFYSEESWMRTFKFEMSEDKAEI